MSLSNYLENELLDHIRGVAYTVPTGLYVKLHTGDPGEDAALLAASEATRKLATFGVASGGSMALNNGPLEWTVLPTTETFSHFSVWDDLTAGNPLGYGPLNSPAAMTAGDTFRLTAATWTLD